MTAALSKPVVIDPCPLCKALIDSVEAKARPQHQYGPLKITSGADWKLLGPEDFDYVAQPCGHLVGVAYVSTYVDGKLVQHIELSSTNGAGAFVEGLRQELPGWPIFAVNTDALGSVAINGVCPHGNHFTRSIAGHLIGSAPTPAVVMWIATELRQQCQATQPVYYGLGGDYGFQPVYSTTTTVAPISSGSMWVSQLLSIVPGLSGATAKCPCPDKGCQVRHYLYPVTNLIQYLNDYHRWTRERIADWLETLTDPEGKPLDFTVVPKSKEEPCPPQSAPAKPLPSNETIKTMLSIAKETLQHMEQKGLLKPLTS